MAGPGGGYVEALPPTLPRRANPHMHLLEALLAWRDEGWEEAADRAGQVVELFRTRFFDSERGTLREFFGPDWAPAPGAAGEVVEPGHHFEWTWLLTRAGCCDEEQRRLYDFGREAGLDPQGFAVDECDRAGRQTKRSRRAWPQTEMIKAQLVMGDRGAAAATVERVLDSYLATERPGLWINHFDENGEPTREAARAVPASTLYHLVLAFREVLSAAGGAD
jgi:mannose-6-phosphate isomerase